MIGERVLITGGSGQLGSDLAALLRGRNEVLAAPHAALDVTDDDSVAAAVATFEPTLVINCAAFHNVEVCEREEDRAFEVNARAVKRLAQRCAASGTRLIHLSTNYVFDGTAARAYDEDALPNPRSIYAISKLAGEHAALSYAPGALVVRTAGLYGLHGSASKGGNFVTRMLKRATTDASLNVVADQRLTPTCTADLAVAIADAADRGTTGVAHLTNAGETSWHGFTEAIMELAAVEVEVRRTVTVRAAGAADRPLNGVLRSRTALPALRPWRDALAEHMDRAGLSALAMHDG